MENDGLQKRPIVDPLGVAIQPVACNAVFNIRVLYSRNSRSRRWLASQSDPFPAGEVQRLFISSRKWLFILSVSDRPYQVWAIPILCTFLWPPVRLLLLLALLDVSAACTRSFTLKSWMTSLTACHMCRIIQAITLQVTLYFTSPRLS